MKKNKQMTWYSNTSDLNMTGKHVAIIGGTGGIGRAISRFMTTRGATVTVVGQTFRDQHLTAISFIQADLSLMTEAHRVAALLPAEKLDILIFTNGIMAAPKRQATAEGIEKDMAVSYLSRLVILRDIAPRLGINRPDGIKPRVFIMGYPGTGNIGQMNDLNANESYSAMSVHMNTVAGNEMLVLDAANRYPNIDVYGLNPGFVKTNIRRNFLGGNRLLYWLTESLVGLFTDSADEYATRMIPMFLSRDLSKYSGGMFNNKGVGLYPSANLTEDYIATFIAASEKLARISR